MASQLEPIYENEIFKKQDNVKKLRVLTEAFCAFANENGTFIRPYTNSSLPHFEKLAVEKQNQILTNFISYFRVYSTASKQKVNLKDNRTVIWHMMKVNNWIPCSDLFSTIENSDLVEIYDSQFIQVFRNLRFFDFCSYSLEEMFCFEWPQLFKRSDSDSSELIKIAGGMVGGQIKESVFPKVGEHIIEEIFSAEMNIFKGVHKCLSPLFDSNKNAIGFIGITMAEIVGKGTTPTPPHSQPSLELV